MKDRYLPLDHLHEGQLGKVHAIESAGSMRRRLQDIGIIEGTEVQCLQKSFSGDPVAYLIRGAVIALRQEDSERILVEATSFDRGREKVLS